MNIEAEKNQDIILSKLNEICKMSGLNNIMAQLYALLYLSNKPLSLNDMMDRLKVSKGNVSINIRELENWGAVRSVWVKGSRKDYYEANIDVKGVILKRVKSSVQKRIGETIDMIDSFNNIIKSQKDNGTAEEKAAVAVYEERLKKMEELKALASTVLVLADKLL